MSKRKLNRRQQRRIEQLQQEREARAQHRTEVLDEDTGALEAEQLGLVIANYGAQALVEGESSGLRQRCFIRANIATLVAGDRVVWRPAIDVDAGGVVTARLQRHAQLQRPDRYGELKTVAANIDRIMIVIAPQPKPFAGVIDRYLVAAEASGITPLLLLNKADLLDTAPQPALEDLLAPYSRLGYGLLRLSARSGAGLSQLVELLAEGTSVFVGQSGVGKSSLAESLLPGITLRTGEVSGSRQKGAHTTTAAELFHLPGGGNLIDSPGIREFGLWHMSEAELLAGFIEFRPFIGHCRFRDCKHWHEPGCAINGAVQRGDISTGRMESFIHLRNSLALK